MHNKYYAYLLNTEASNLRFLKIIITFMKQNSKKILDTATKTGLDAAKFASKKTDEATGEIIGNKIVEKIVKPKPIIGKNSGNVEE